MIRWLSVLSVVTTMAAALFVFQIKYRAEGVAKRVSNLEHKIDQERETISLLKAEWSYLIQPTRIQEVVERHADNLRLEPIGPGQIGTLGQLPRRRPNDEDISETPIGSALASNAEGVAQ